MDNTQVFAFSNVHLKLYNKKNHRLLKEVHKKNTITKYTLNGIASMLKGEFSDTNYIQINKYVPKYLALGTNLPTDDTTVTVKNYVTVNDDSLYGEILKNGKPNRTKLEQAKRVDNTSTNEFVKIRFRTMVTAGSVSYNAVIQELGLFVDNTDIKGGLFARITTEPITIPENSVLDVQWDVVLTSSTGVYPTSVYLLDDTDRIISDSTVELPLHAILPITANLESSVVDTNNSKSEIAVYTPSFDNLVWTGDDSSITTQVTNNFSPMVTFAEVRKNGSTYDIYTWNSFNFNKELNSSGYSTQDSAKDYVAENNLLCATDMSGNTVLPDTIANAFAYKDVTYTNCTWNFYNGAVLIKEWDGNSYSTTGTFVTYNNCIYRNTYAPTTVGEFVPQEWDKVLSYIKYMVNIVLINNKTVIMSDYNIGLEVVTATGVKSKTTINCKGV